MENAEMVMPAIQTPALGAPQAYTWGIGFHGTSVMFDAFTNDDIGKGNDYNTGLGIFATHRLAGAKPYARRSRSKPAEGRADILLVAIPRLACIVGTHEDFWCFNDGPWTEDDIDQMGYPITIPGEATRRRFQEQGYLSLRFDDPEEMGTVTAVFDAKDTHILARISLETADKLEAWLKEAGFPEELGFEHWPQIQSWLVQHSQKPQY